MSWEEGMSLDTSKLLKSEKSQFLSGGPVRISRPLLPNV